MQYLQSQPFTVGLGSRKFAEGWDRIFSRKMEGETEASAAERSPDTERAPAMVEGDDDHDLGDTQG